jgi:hypothetical protein
MRETTRLLLRGQYYSHGLMTDFSQSALATEVRKTAVREGKLDYAEALRGMAVMTPEGLKPIRDSPKAQPEDQDATHSAQDAERELHRLRQQRLERYNYRLEVDVNKVKQLEEMDWDLYWEKQGCKRPPTAPPPLPEFTPEEIAHMSQTHPRVSLDRSWAAMMATITVTLMLMLKYGKYFFFEERRKSAAKAACGVSLPFLS